MQDDKRREIPQSDPVDEPVNARAFDADGNVRPADGRWLGDRNDDVPAEQLQAEREQQIADAQAVELERMRKQNAEPDAQLQGEAGPEITPAGDGTVLVPELKGQALDDALKARDLPVTGTADEKRARVAGHDAANPAQAE